MKNHYRFLIALTCCLIVVDAVWAIAVEKLNEELNVVLFEWIWSVVSEKCKKWFDCEWVVVGCVKGVK